MSGRLNSLRPLRLERSGRLISPGIANAEEKLTAKTQRAQRSSRRWHLLTGGGGAMRVKGDGRWDNDGGSADVAGVAVGFGGFVRGVGLFE